MTVQIWPAVAGQDGVDGGGVWVPGVVTLTLPADGSRLAGVRISGLPTLGNQTAFAYRYMVLVPFRHDANAGTVTVYSVPSADPPPFSNSNLPRTNDYPLCSLVISAADALLGANALLGIMLDTGPLGGLGYRRANFTGTVAFSIQWVGVGDMVLASANGGVSAPYLLTDGEAPINTGEPGRWAPHEQLGICDRSGIVLPLGEMVADGFSPALRVHPDWADPPEPLPPPIRPEKPSR